MRKVLIVDVFGAAGEDLLDAARQLGVWTVVATHEDIYQGYSRSVREKIGEPLFVNLVDAGAAIKTLVGHGRVADVDGVLACWEFLSPIATKVAAELGLPGHRPELAHACRNKRLMAEVFEQVGVPAPQTVPVTSLEQARSAADRLSFPVVVKPAENGGSVGVSVAECTEQLAEAFSLASAWPHEFPHGIALDNTILVQEYLDGAEYSVEVAVHDGELHCLAVVAKVTTEGRDRAEIGHTVPADLEGGARASVLDVAERTAKALGLVNGVAHIELKLLPDGTAKVIELGARPPGGHIMPLIKQALGVDEARAYLQIALGQAPDLAPTRQWATGIRFLTSPADGTFQGLRDVPNWPALVECRLLRTPGERITSPRDNLGRVAQVVLRADSARRVDELADELMATVKVEVG